MLETRISRCWEDLLVAGPPRPGKPALEPSNRDARPYFEGIVGKFISATRQLAVVTMTTARRVADRVGFNLDPGGVSSSFCTRWPLQHYASLSLLNINRLASVASFRVETSTFVVLSEKLTPPARSVISCLPAYRNY